MEGKNLSLELLKRLLNDEIRGFKRTNVVKSEEFSDRLKKALNSYVNGLITNEEVIEELMRMAQDIRNASQAGNDLGLSIEEVAFYDALCKPEAVKDFYENDQLVQIAKELTDILRHSVSIDWQRKESARAGIRKNIRRLLRKYHYPPEEIPGAIDLVLSQAELMANNLSQYL
ncbi:type I restriction enzyme endonuclease domain-containing protein [Allobaculum sp. Allo2]